MALNKPHTVQFHIDPHSGTKSITGGVGAYPSARIMTINQTDIDHFVSDTVDVYNRGHPTIKATRFLFGYGSDNLRREMITTMEDAVKIRGFFRGVAVEVDENGLQVMADPTEQMSETEVLEANLAEVKRGQNNLALSVAALIRSREQEVSRIYGGFRLEIVAATDTKPMYADLFGLDVIDPNPANEATDTIVCSINMVGANMCQHKQYPDMPDNNQWVIEVQTADGKAHRFHTHSSGDFGLIFDAIRAGVTTKVYSTRPATPQQPSPDHDDSGSET